MKRTRFRYILSGKVKGSDKISNFRLIGANKVPKSYHNYSAIKVNIPDDLELEKWSCDSYSITRDNRTLDELGYDILIWDYYNRKWEVHNEFKHLEPHEFPNVFPTPDFFLNMEIIITNELKKTKEYIKNNLKYYHQNAHESNRFKIVSTDFDLLENVHDNIMKIEDYLNR